DVRADARPPALQLRASAGRVQHGLAGHLLLTLLSRPPPPAGATDRLAAERGHHRRRVRRKARQRLRRRNGPRLPARKEAQEVERRGAQGRKQLMKVSGTSLAV